MKNNVVIRRQKIRIKTSSEQLALKLRAAVNDAVQYGLLDVYDSVFNAKEFEGMDNVFIDKISLNIGKCSEDDFSAKLAGLVKNALIDHLHQPSTGSEKMRIEQIEAGNTNSAGSSITALLYYLEHGVYPWWFTAAIYRSPAEIIAQLDSVQWQDIISGIMALQRNNPGAASSIRKRFINCTGSAHYGHAINYLVANAIGMPGNHEQLSFDVLVKLITSQFGLDARQVEANLVDYLLACNGQKKGDLLGSFAARFFTRFGRQVDIAGLKPVNELPQSTRDYLKELIQQPVEFNLGEQAPQDEPAALNKDAGPDAVYVSNAGLVILHPFLAPLFEALGLLSGGKTFVNSLAAFKAVCLLHYLQTGSVQYEEQFMALNKIMCGIGIQTALPANVLLTGAELSECDALLEALVTHWEALKSSSAGAVRETFLTRNGKLAFKEGSYLLQVERQPVDVLMDRLPWGISTIKLPWLQQIIYTEW